VTFLELVHKIIICIRDSVFHCWIILPLLDHFAKANYVDFDVNLPSDST